VFIYWAFFAILATGALLNQEESAGRLRLMFMILVSVPTALMIGLRWEIGPDWPNYLDIFNYTKLVSFDQAIRHQDPAYTILNWLLHRFAAPFWVINLICGLVFVAGLTAFCKRQPNPWLAYLVAFPYLIVVVAMSGNRQSVALGFLFFSLNAFERGRLIRFVLLIMAAALFHGSILLLLPVCLMSYTQNGVQRAILLLAGALIGYYYFQDLFGVYAERYSSVRIQSTGVVYRLAMNALSAVIFLIFERRFELEEHLRKLWRNISVCTLALVPLLLVFPSSTAIDRFLLYLFPLQFAVLGRVPKVLSGHERAATQLTLLVIAYAGLVQIVFLVFGTYASFYVPYHSIFDR
jgi:hypothetical protein